METTDANFWKIAVQYWHDKAEFYLGLGCTEDFERCLNRAELADLNLREVRGEILVYGPEIYLRK